MKKIFLAVCLTIAATLYAQTLNLEEARSLALAASRSLAKYDLALQNSALDEKSQFYSMLPSVQANYNASLTYSMSYLNDKWKFEYPFNTFSTGARLSVTQKIFEGGKSFVQKALSSIATESVRQSAMEEYFNVLDSVDNAYYSVLEAAKNLTVAESSLQTAALSLSMAEIRQASGMINQGDYLKSLADKESRENNRNQARRNYALAQAKLKSLIGLEELPALEQVNFDSYENVLAFLSGITDEQADALYDRFLALSIQSNHSLARAALASQRAEKNLSLTKRDSIPTISATLFSTDLSWSPERKFHSGTSGGIYLSGNIPLDFWVLNNRIEKSKIAVNSAALDYISAEKSLEAELQSALIGVFAQAGSVLSSRRALQYAEKHLEYVVERYRLSQSSVSDLSDASALETSNRLQLLRSEYSFLQSISKLRSLGAFEDEEKLITILTGESL